MQKRRHALAEPDGLDGERRLRMRMTRVATLIVGALLAFAGVATAVACGSSEPAAAPDPVTVTEEVVSTETVYEEYVETVTVTETVFEDYGGDQTLDGYEESEPANDGDEVGGGCDPSYVGACVPPYDQVGDLDCADVGPVQVVGSDPHGLDGDGDGYGCE